MAAAASTDTDAIPTSPTGTEPKPLKPLRASSAKTQYLIVYNAVSALLWLVVLGRVLLLVPLVGFGSVYTGVGQFAKWTQTLAALEVVHALLGVVRAPVGTTAMQVASRFLLVWLIVDPFPFLAKSSAYSSMLFAWSVTEVIRYSFFMLSLSGILPKALAWLRYNTFFVLYPLGISSEVYMMYLALGPAQKARMEYKWLIQLVMFIYIPGSYILYTHMMAQRKKVMRAKQV